VQEKSKYVASEIFKDAPESVLAFSGLFDAHSFLLRTEDAKEAESLRAESRLQFNAAPMCNSLY